MPFQRLLKKIAKDFLIEVISLGAAYIADISLREPEESPDLFTTAFSLRIYYLSKNILNIVDAKLNQSTINNHVNAALFNAGVASLLYPSAHSIYGDRISDRMASAAVVYTGGILSRGLIEKIRQKQTLQSHLTLHAGNLTGGVFGIVFSALKNAGIASPSFYWTAEFVDIIRNKPNTELFTDLFWSSKTTVPLQVFLAYFIKLSLTSAHISLPMPAYIIDFLLGNMHRFIVHKRDYLHSEQTSLPTTTLTEIKVITPELKLESKSQINIENSSASLTWLMKRGLTVQFHIPAPKITIVNEKFSAIKPPEVR